MQVVHKNDLVIDKKIAYSYASSIVGSLIILPWGGALKYFYQEISTFPLVLNILTYPLFFIILMKQYKQVFISDKFLIAFSGSKIIFSMNHGIKEPDMDKNYFLSLSPGDDFIKLKIVKGYKTIKNNLRGRNELKNHHYISFELKQKVPLAIKELHQKIASAQGFTGSLVEIKENKILYHIEGNFFQAKKIAKELIKRGLFSGKYTKEKLS